MILDFAASLANPAVLTLWSLALAGLITLLGHWRIGAAAVLLACGWTCVWSIPMASDSLRASLERQYPPRDEATLPMADAIVVLGGGGSYRWLAHEDVDPDDLPSSRIAAGARAWIAGRAPLVILSGGGVGENTEARTMARAIVHLGVPASALVLEQRSRSTRENARNSAALSRELGITKILLVTSSLHMPRAVLEFRGTTLDIVPVAVPERSTRGSWRQRWLPSRTALRRSSRALKEVAALVATHFNIGRNSER